MTKYLTEEKWDAYEEMVKANIANHKAKTKVETDIEDKAYLKFLDTIIKAHTEEAQKGGLDNGRN